MALFLAAYSLWNDQDLEGIGWLVLIELDRINHKLPSLPKKRDPKSEAIKSSFELEGTLHDLCVHRRHSSPVPP